MTQPHFTIENGFEIRTRCLGCPQIQAIVDAALADMAPHREAQGRIMKGAGLTDVSTGNIRLFPDTQPLSQQLTPLGIAIKRIHLTAQNDINNLTRNCPGRRSSSDRL